MNRYYDKISANMLLGALYKQPSLFDSPEINSLDESDFVEPISKLAYSIMFNLYSIGHSKFNTGIIESYLQGRPSSFSFYNKEDENGEKQGEFYFNKLAETGEASVFGPSFEKVKKMTLLRSLEKHGVSVKQFYDWDTVDPKIQQYQEHWLETTSIKDIANIISDSIAQIMNDSSSDTSRVSIQAGDGLRDLIDSFNGSPDYGAPFPIQIMDTVVRGARLGKFYLRSAPTGGGKSRLMMADACHMSIDKYYDWNSHSWIENGIKEGALFISTELDTEECQTMALAYISGVDEDLILDGLLNEDQKAVVSEAITILEESPLYFELIPDFSIQDIESTIRLFYREKDCKYFFFDYIHTSMKFLAEIAAISNGMKLREDQILFMLSTKLKDLAVQLQIFIESGTQVNGDWLEGELNQNLLRGAKAIADRLDVGMIATKVRPVDEAVVETFVNSGYIKPNYVISFYKIRRGKYAGTKLWCHADLGTCRVKGLFLTDSNNEPIGVDKATIKVVKAAEKNVHKADKAMGANKYKDSAF